MTLSGAITDTRLTVGTDLPMILVATDSADASGAAHRTAILLAEINDVHVRAISIQSRPSEIAHFAAEHDARLIVVGMTSAETPARLVWSTHRPLLAASQSMHTLPHRIVIAMDLDPSQLGDFAPVLSLFGRASSMTCLHVQVPENFPGSETPVFARAYDRAVSEAFADIGDAAKSASGIPAELVRVKGDPAEEIIRFAKSSRAELLVLGLRRHFGSHTLEGGRVARAVLRGSPCSVLIVPERRSVSDTAS
jgi:nucleotide-binding universal stress UspA family protein